MQHVVAASLLSAEMISRNWVAEDVFMKQLRSLSSLTVALEAVMRTRSS